MVTDQEAMRLAVIIEVKAIGADYVPESFDWLEFPKRQMQALIYMAREIFWK